MLHVGVAALDPNFPSNHFAFSIQKERHRQKNNAAVALFKRGCVANHNWVVDELTFISLAQSEISSVLA